MWLASWNRMDKLKVLVRCKDCGKERTLEVSSPIIPVIGGFSCISDGRESEASRCTCGCEAFYVLRLL